MGIRRCSHCVRFQLLPFTCSWKSETNFLRTPRESRRLTDAGGSVFYFAPWCVVLPFPAALLLTPPALPEYALNSWMNISIFEFCCATITCRHEKCEQSSFFLFFCKGEEVPANMPHPYQVSWPPSSWKVFALLIFSEISETGTKNSSPPPSFTSDRTIALTMESIRCVAPSLNPVHERLSIPLTGKGIIQCHLSCPLQKLTRERGWIFHRVWCHLLVLLIPPISLVKMLSEHDNRVVMTAGEALASPPSPLPSPFPPPFPPAL